MRWPHLGCSARAFGGGEGRAGAASGVPPAWPLPPADLLWAAGSLANLHRRPFDAALVARALVPTVTTGTLIDLLPQLGLTARWIGDRFAARATLAAPVVVLLRAGATAGAGSATACRAPAASWTQGAGHAGEPGTAQDVGPPPWRLALLVRLDPRQAVLFPAGSHEPLTLVREAFDAACAEGHLRTAPTEAQGLDDLGAPAGGADPGFGFRWFVPELARHRRVWRDVLIASFVVQAIALAVPLASQTIIDKVIVHRTPSTLAVIATALFAGILFSAGLGWIRQVLVVHTGNRVDAVLGSAVFAHLIRLPAVYFERRPTGVLAARMNGIETIREFLSGTAVTVVLDVPFLGLFVVLMFVYSAPLSLLALSLLALLVGVSVVFAPWFRSCFDTQFQAGARAQAFVTEYVAGVETVKSLTMEPQLERRYETLLGAALSAQFATRRLGATYQTIASALEQALSAAVLCAGAWLVMQGPDFTVGMLVAFQMFAARVAQPMLKLAGLWQQFQQATIAVRRLADILDVPAEPRSLAAVREGGGAGRLEMRNVSFRYGRDRPYVLQGFDLVVEPGACVAITGPSGAGKSTLARLLQGFAWPAEGAVLVDGRDTRHLPANDLRSRFGVVPQETVLFAGTLHDNLLLADPLASFASVVQACKLAGIHATIEALPQGYATDVGERGAGLSGGQRQRIAIARALLKRPRILVFDEATASLDAPLADEIAATIHGLRGRATIVFITHRVPPTLKPDRVLHLAPVGAGDEHLPGRERAAGD